MEIITQIHKRFIEFLLTLQRKHAEWGAVSGLYVSEISRTC